MSKLDNIIDQAYPDGMTPSDDPEYKQAIKDLFLEVLDSEGLDEQSVHGPSIRKKIEEL